METRLRELQLTQLEILKLFDKICKKNQLHYSLYGGTQLGAIRHKGFIPWDDDLDVAMAREDYNRFLSVWEQEKIDGYILQNKENTPAFSQSFSKIRKDNTTFIEYEGEGGLHHTGIFIDIFPVDRIPNGRIARVFFRVRCMIFQLFTREFVPPNSSFFIKMVTKLLLALTSHNHRMDKREILLKKITKYAVDPSLNRICIETMNSLSQICPADLFDDFVTLEFEDFEAMSVKKWDEWLKLQFGDYMQLPPVEERTWTHHPILIDFEHNYEDLMNNKGE